MVPSEAGACRKGTGKLENSSLFQSMIEEGPEAYSRRARLTALMHEGDHACTTQCSVAISARPLVPYLMDRPLLTPECLSLVKEACMSK
jgi:hypothetical protein